MVGPIIALIIRLEPKGLYILDKKEYEIDNKGILTVINFAHGPNDTRRCMMAVKIYANFTR